MAVHIGKIIKGLVKQRGLSVTAFADDINYSRRNVYEIFDRESIDTGLLLKIGRVLGENLFWYYIPEEERAKQAKKQANMEELYDMLKNLEKKLEAKGKARKRKRA